MPSASPAARSASSELSSPTTTLSGGQTPSRHEYREPRVVDDALGDAPQQEAADRPASPAPHDDELEFQLLAEVQDGLGRRAVQQAGLRGDARRLDLTHPFLEEPARLPLVDVHVVGPHHRGVAEALRGQSPRVRDVQLCPRPSGEESLRVEFGPGTGLMTRMSGMRYRDREETMTP
jgi:hypothetical protein